MNRQDIIALFHDPDSAWGLRHRASKLPQDNNYAKMLLILADAQDLKKLSSIDCFVFIQLARSGHFEKGMEMLGEVLRQRSDK